jgi:hypothetical protein
MDRKRLTIGLAVVLVMTSAIGRAASSDPYNLAPTPYVNNSPPPRCPGTPATLDVQIDALAERGGTAGAEYASAGGGGVPCGECDRKRQDCTNQCYNNHCTLDQPGPNEIFCDNYRRYAYNADLQRCLDGCDGVVQRCLATCR